MPIIIIVTNALLKLRLHIRIGLPCFPFSRSYIHSCLQALSLSVKLLEHLPVRPCKLLPLHLYGLFPRPHIIHKLPILFLTRVQLCKLVALVVGSDVKGGQRILAADDEGAFDDRVILFAKDGGGAENVFAGGFEAGEEAAWIGLLVKVSG